jgi:hypothetical protein
LSQQEDQQLCLDRLCQRKTFQNKITFHSYLNRPYFLFGHVIGNQQFFFFLPNAIT